MPTPPNSQGHDWLAMSALLSPTVLKDERTFNLPDFLEGKSPPANEIAVAHRLVAVR
jgi:hypothetical protein